MITRSPPAFVLPVDWTDIYLFYYFIDDAARMIGIYSSSRLGGNNWIWFWMYGLNTTLFDLVPMPLIYKIQPHYTKKTAS